MESLCRFCWHHSRAFDPVVMPFSCCVFLPDAAPGLTVPALDALGAVWVCADAMSVEPKREATTRAEIASLDRIGKSPLVTRITPNPGVRFRSGAGRTLRKFHIAKKSFAIAAQAFITFPNIRHVPNIGFAQSASNSAFAIGGIRNVSERYEESSLSKMRGHDVIAGHRARKTGFRFPHLRMPEVLRHRNIGDVDLLRDRCL